MRTLFSDVPRTTLTAFYWAFILYLLLPLTLMMAMSFKDANFVAFPIGERTDDPLKMYLADIFTIAANLAGICGLSVPCGFVEEGGSKLPVGLQFLGKAFDETRLLGIADAYEKISGWTKEVASV